MCDKPCNGILRFLNGRKLAPRVAQALLKQAAAHRRLRGVDHMAQRTHAFTPVEAAEQFQIALRNVVDEEVLAEIQRLERRKMFGVLHLRLFQVGEQCAAGLHQLFAAFQTQGSQFGDGLGGKDALGGTLVVEMAPQRDANGLNVREVQRGRDVGVFRQQEFARGDLLRPLPEFLTLFDVQPGPVAGGDVHPRESAAIRVGTPEQGPEIGMPLGLEADVLNGGPGRVDAGDGTLDKPLGGSGVFDLIAEGDLVALVQELADVAFGGMPRDAAHGNGGFRVGIARSQRDLKLTRGDFGILEKKFIKVAHAIKEQGVRIALLDAEVLFEHRSKAGRCGLLAHMLQ